MNRIESWMEVVDRFQKRLSAWKARSLSIGGYLTLTTTVLGNLPTYYLSIFRAPIWVIDILERIRRRFFWGSTTTVKRAKNLGLIGKWRWGFLNEGNALWCKVIKAIYGPDGGLQCDASSHLKRAIYGPDGGLQCDASSRLKRGMWFDIIKGGFDVARLGIPFRNSFHKIVSSGDDGIRIGSAPRGRSIDELTSLLDQLKGFSLSTDSRDRWRWSLSTNDLFTVNNLSKLIDLHYLIPGGGGSGPIFLLEFLGAKKDKCAWLENSSRSYSSSVKP
ncbi:hypothetical protein Tco_1469637 [Tanacetum coccineum]